MQFRGHACPDVGWDGQPLLGIDLMDVFAGEQHAWGLGGIPEELNPFFPNLQQFPPQIFRMKQASRC
jgi:hypothetical protein